MCIAFTTSLATFGDSNLYLRRTNEHLVLSSEHRAAPAAPHVSLQLVGSEAETHLEVIGEFQDQQPQSLQDQVLVCSRRECRSRAPSSAARWE